MITRLTTAAADRLRAAPLTYPEHGQTRGDLPAGYRPLRISQPSGTGADAFAAAAAALMSWEMHDRSGLRPRTDSGTIGPGSVAILRFGWGSASVRIPVRVVYVVAEPRRRGFAYGTLPGHPEQGEESFLVEWPNAPSQYSDDAVIVTLTAFSRPRRWFTRMGGPLGREVQHRVTERYLTALRGGGEPLAGLGLTHRGRGRAPRHPQEPDRRQRRPSSWS